MSLEMIASTAAQFVKDKAPEILTGLGVVGLAATGFLAAKAGAKASEKIYEAAQKDPRYYGVGVTKTEKLKLQTKLVWKDFATPVGVGIASAACIVGSNHASGRRTAVAVAAYTATEKAFGEYRKKAVMELGEIKDKKIRDAMAQEKVNEVAKNSPTGKDVVVVGSGAVLCCELYTGRYFMSDMEALRQAVNTINSRLLNSGGLYVALDDFYDEIGLPYTSASSIVGWTSDRQLQLEFSSVISSDGRPCLAFEYNYVKPVSN